jgi:hypothetical protein
MKRIIVLVALCALPFMAFADLQIGPALSYEAPLKGISSDPSPLDHLKFGAEARLKFWLFQAGTAVYYWPAAGAYGAELNIVPDIGVSLDLLFLRFGAGVGYDYWLSLENRYEPGIDGYNLKLSIDFELGRLSLGLVGYYWLDTLGEIPGLFGGVDGFTPPQLAAALLYRLF